MTKFIYFVAVVIWLGVALTFSPSPNNTSSASFSTDLTNQIENQSIVIGYSNWAGWWPWAIAEKKELFAQNGVDVELKWYDDYTKSMEDLQAGEIDGNCQTLNDTVSFAEDSLKGETVILINDNSAGNDKIIGAPGINSIADLANKRVAVEEGVVDDFLLTLALEKQGMSRDDVEIVGAETGAAVEAFAAGQADAVGAFPPFWLTALKREGAKEIASSAEFPGAIPDLLVVTEELAQESPDIAQNLVNTWFDTLDYMKKHPAESDEIMAERAGIGSKQLKLFKEGTKMFTLEDNIEAFRGDQKNMQDIYYAAQEISSFQKDKLKLIKKKPKLKKLINSDFIEDAAK